MNIAAERSGEKTLARSIARSDMFRIRFASLKSRRIAETHESASWQMMPPSPTIRRSTSLFSTTGTRPSDIASHRAFSPVP